MHHRTMLAFGCALGAVIGHAGAQSAPTPDRPEGEAKAKTTPRTITIQPAAIMTWDELVRFDRERVGPPEPWVVPAPKHWKQGFELGPPRAQEGDAVTPRPAPAAARATCDELDTPTITQSFLGLEDGVATIPPDTMGAVGPNDIVVMLNDRVRLLDRTGAVINTVSLSSFWAPVVPSSPFDPVIMYDAGAERWIACVDSHRRSATSRILFAISATSDPGGAWSFYSIDADSTDLGWADFPRMGYNSTWIALTNNMFTIAGDSFLGASMWVIDKASALAGGPLTITTFEFPFDNEGGVFGASLTPATTHDVTEPALWIIDAVGFTTGGVQSHRLSSITGTGPAPVWAPAPGGPFPGTGLFPVPTNYTTGTPRAQQLGTSTRIATNGARIYDADFRNGRLWYTHVGGLPDGAPTRTSSFWYEIDPSVGASSPIVQSGVIDANEEFHFFPSIAVNCAGDMMLGFTRSNFAIYAEAAFTWRNASDPLGTTRPVVQIKAGEDAYLKDFGSGTVRWGDYSSTVVDPVDDRSMWTLQEYAGSDVGGSNSDDRWGTWWARLFAPASCPGDIDGDGFTNAADFTILAGNFGASVAPNTAGDLNGDGLVNAADFTILAGDFGCPN